MGLQLSNFSTFYELQDKNLYDSNVKRVFAKFKLFVIILCAPEDVEFSYELENAFPQLDEQTGKNLLFISFTNKEQHRFTLKRLVSNEIDFDKESLRRLGLLTKNHPVDDVELADIARRFNIVLRQLPVLIITNDLCGNEAIVIDTNKEEFGDQLVKLSYYASTHEGPIALDEIDLRRFQPYKTKVQSTVAEVLTRVFAQMQGSDDTTAKDYLEHALRETREKLDSSDGVSLSEIDKLLQQYANDRLAYQNVHEEAERPSPYFINEDRLAGAEQETLVSLKTYNRFASILNDEDEYDYAYLSSGIGRMFETELNSSVVQQMRRLIGIPMPDYFMNYYPTSKDESRFIITTGKDHTVNLNELENYTQWKTISIGDSWHVYKTLLNMNYAHELTLNRGFFYREWKSLCQNRNAVAHVIRQESFGSFKKTFENFCRCLDKGYFQQLVDIKMTVKPREDEPSVLH